MGNHRIRTDKTCQNCSYVVENKFCPNCGQENTESRQSFHYLFTHFAEDLTHYDISFWKTIKALLLKPGMLTQEYLSGKRKKFVPPVKLYIFISFVTFFIPNILPNVSLFGGVVTEEVTLEEVTVDEKDAKQLEGFEIFKKQRFSSIQELDSIQKYAPEPQKFSPSQYRIAKTVFNLRKLISDQELWDKVSDSFIHNLPKVLFLYMPLFAFFLWLLHDKKKWFYFDSGVFTLHYFSFLLLIITVNVLFNWLLELIYYIDPLFSFVALVSALYCFFYFFRAHRKVFGETKFVSRSKGFLLFFVNAFWIVVALVGLFIYSLSHVQ